MTVLAVAGLAARGPDQADAARPSGLTWSTCAENPAADCAALRVPVDWADPYGPRIDVAVARRAAADPARRIGVLVVNPGGPGESGVDLALGAPAYFSPELLRRFDIVGFDPRGVGRSHPIRCSADLSAAAPSPLGARLATLAAYNRRLAADCRARSGPLFDHADTASVVRDLDALRAALGERTLSFYGVSYGTLMGQQYLARYPQRTRAVVLDSVMDHSAGVRDFLDAEAAAAQAGFDEFVAWCGRDELCALRGRDVRAVWAALLRRAATGTLADPVDPRRPLDTYGLLSVAFGSLYGPDWYALAYYLQSAASGGAAATPAARAAVARAARWSAAPATTLADNPFAAAFCADWSLPVPSDRAYAGALARSARIAPDMRLSPLAVTAVTACLGGPVRTAFGQRVPPRAQQPVLLLNARYDPATPLAWAQTVAGHLGSRARLVTYLGWGHAAYARGACTRAAVDGYLLTLTLPAAGATCPAVEPEPFGIGRRGGPARPAGPRPTVPGWAG
ncbi:alpha/beta fold hydrolase [Spirilliplanes yamanashiensis]|uniref:alpha/beta fold hydrolase n=1 Tax=Spirilliplanes yamanashiensis TaxID=42233 RepID=UPI0027858C92|nr:alpha/beta fold hydrolase [Spirilliplanes yamanashiensis]MDP9818822.1 pimeloyl-ACP methyl ester carboxylesterase [Spirilliplanes yamanashiensis]